MKIYEAKCHFKLTISSKFMAIYLLQYILCKYDAYLLSNCKYSFLFFLCLIIKKNTINDAIRWQSTNFELQKYKENLTNCAMSVFGEHYLAFDFCQKKTWELQNAIPQQRC